MTKKKKTPPTFAEIMTDWRTKAGLSQYALARLAGITSAYVSKIELGQQELDGTSFHVMRQLCAALGKSVDDLATMLHIAENDVTPPPKTKSNTPIGIAEILKDWREKARMTPYALAQKSGVTEPTITLIESGDRRPELITFRVVSKLCKALGRSLHELNDLLPPPILGEMPAKRGRPTKAEVEARDK